MINKEYGKTILSCDICEEQFKFDSFDEAVDYKKDNNWKSKKIKNEWIDMCPSCKRGI